MKWFKHLSDAGNDPAIHDAISLFGSDAYYVFFRTIEIMSDHIDVKNPGKNSFSRPFLSKNFNISFKKVSEILQFFSEKEKIYLEITQNGRLEEYHLNIPKLKDLTDEYTSKVIRSESGQTPDRYPESVRKKSPINKKKKKKENIKEKEGDFVPAHPSLFSFDSYENIEKVCEKHKVDFDHFMSSCIKNNTIVNGYESLVPMLKSWQKNGWGKIDEEEPVRYHIHQGDPRASSDGTGPLNIQPDIEEMKAMEKAKEDELPI